MAKAKALVADGDPGFAELLAARLTALGFEVSAAVDGEEALRLARRELPLLLIAEEGLAKIDGLKLCRLLKFDKRRATVAVVLTSAALTDEGRQLAETVHASGYVQKQADSPELLAFAQSLLTPETPSHAGPVEQ